MDRSEWHENDLEIASVAVVRAAGRDFAAALAETPQFQAFEQAYLALSQDSAAQQARSAYQAKAEALRAVLMLNAVSEPERRELERLKQAYLAFATVKAYDLAQAELTALCRQVAQAISAAIGLDYATACGASCCG